MLWKRKKQNQIQNSKPVILVFDDDTEPVILPEIAEKTGDSQTVAQPVDNAGKTEKIGKTRKKKKGKKKTDLLTVFFSLLMIVGWYIFSYPMSAGLLNKIYNINTITSYQNDLTSYSDEDLANMINKCQEYNQTIAEEQKEKVFKYRGSNVTDTTYESLPVANTIGSLNIPKLGINIAIGHGTNDKLLQGSAGHLYGTSLPVEGNSVHAVIAAHSALASAELFTHLNRLVKGDIFYITVLNKQYEYKVIDINTVLPEDDYKYEQVEEGKNYVTLYTCTPYGINTHRLLVKGEFQNSTTVEINKGFSLTMWLPVIKYSCELAVIILAPFIVSLVYDIYEANKRKKKKKIKAQEAN